MKAKSKSTLRQLLSESLPILKDMGVKPGQVKYRFEKSGEKHIPRGYSGWAKKGTVYVASNRPIQTIVRTIAHETKHIIDPKAQKAKVGIKVAERRAYAFENRFVKKYRKEYYE